MELHNCSHMLHLHESCSPHAWNTASENTSHCTASGFPSEKTLPFQALCLGACTIMLCPSKTALHFTSCAHGACCLPRSRSCQCEQSRVCRSIGCLAVSRNAQANSSLPALHCSTLQNQTFGQGRDFPSMEHFAKASVIKLESEFASIYEISSL